MSVKTQLTDVETGVVLVTVTPSADEVLSLAADLETETTALAAALEAETTALAEALETETTALADALADAAAALDARVSALENLPTLLSTHTATITVTTLNLQAGMNYLDAPDAATINASAVMTNRSVGFLEVVCPDGGLTIVGGGNLIAADQTLPDSSVTIFSFIYVDSRLALSQMGPSIGF